MEKVRFNFENFELPFLKEIENEQVQSISDDEIEESDNMNLVKENMESKLPKSAIYLGAVDTELDHMSTSWNIRDYYYLFPIKDDLYDWAIFRISWDDNFQRWELIPDGRIKGLKNDYAKAAKLTLNELWENWQIDLNDPENEIYLNLLSQF